MRRVPVGPNQLAGPPIGALLFTAGRALPFVTQAILIALGAVLVSRIVVSGPVRTGEKSHVRRDVADGIRWLWGHPPIRTLTLTIVFFNITYGAAWSVLVLYTEERLGLGEVGFGIVTTMGALGGPPAAVALWLLRPERFAAVVVSRERAIAPGLAADLPSAN